MVTIPSQGKRLTHSNVFLIPLKVKHKAPKGKGLEGNNIVNIKVLLTIRRFRLTVHRWIQVCHFVLIS